MFVFDKLFTIMEQKHITKSQLMSEAPVTAGTLRRLKNNQTVNLYTLDLISRYLECTIFDLFTYIE